MIFRLAITAAALLAAVGGLSACESTQETSQRLSLNAKKLLNVEGLKVTKQNARIKVTSTAVLHDQYGSAVVVNLANSGKTQLAVPIAVKLLGKKKKKIWDNSLAGLDTSLISTAVVEPGRSFWVNNQIQSQEIPRSAKAKVGISETPLKTALPKIALSKEALKSDVSGAYLSGVITNNSKIIQKRIVISCISSRGTTIKAAGRAIIERLQPAPTKKPNLFRVYFIGNPKGGSMKCLAPPTTLTGD
jgi:hypothetical protein